MRARLRPGSGLLSFLLFFVGIGIQSIPAHARAQTLKSPSRPGGGLPCRGAARGGGLFTGTPSRFRVGMAYQLGTGVGADLALAFDWHGRKQSVGCFVCAFCALCAQFKLSVSSLCAQCVLSMCVLRLLVVCSPCVLNVCLVCA